MRACHLGNTGGSWDAGEMSVRPHRLQPVGGGGLVREQESQGSGDPPVGSPVGGGYVDAPGSPCGGSRCHQEQLPRLRGVPSPGEGAPRPARGQG